MAPLLPPVFRHGAPARRNRHTRKRAAWAANVEKGRPRGRPGGKVPFFLPLKRASRQSAAAYGNGAWKLFGESPLPEGVEAFVLLGRPWRKGGCIVRIIRRLGYGGT